jgi:thiol-disulfide isomerase/thioredoxin
LGCGSTALGRLPHCARGSTKTTNNVAKNVLELTMFIKGLIMAKIPLRIVFGFIIAYFAMLASPIIAHATADVKPPLTGVLLQKAAWLDEEKALLPNIAFDAPNGETIQTRSYMGKWVLLHYWATWCPPCVEEIPSLDALQKKFSNTRLKVITTSADTGGPALIENYFKRHNIKYLTPYTVIPDDALGLPVNGVPTSFIINPRQEVLLKVEGAIDWAAPDVQKFLAALMSISVPKE